jgi:hypothetical protein
MAKWDAENGTAIDDDVDEELDDDPLDYDEALEKYRRVLFADSNAIDHIFLGTSDFDQAMTDFTQLTGIEPVMVVSLNGLGTKSARVGFNECCFLEIVGPDPKQADTPMKHKLSGIEAGKLVPLHYAVRHDETMKTIKSETLPNLGYGFDQITMVAKDRGMPWQWDMVILEDHSDGGLAPIYCHWGKSTHGASKLPQVGRLVSVKVRVRDAQSPILQLLSKVDGVDAGAAEGGQDMLAFTFTSEKGTHTFSTSSPIGIAFPKEGGLPVKHAF